LIAGSAAVSLLPPIVIHRGEPMSLSLEALWKMSDVDLLAKYHEVRRQHIERKFARDTQRARLDWLKARVFATSAEMRAWLSFTQECG
jgi:hypothetical protein